MAWSAGQRYAAEFLGTFALLAIGGGSAVFSLSATTGFDPDARVVVVSLAFGLVIVAMAYIFGDISGGHFNPAVTVSMGISGRMPARDVVPYLLAQVAGGIVGISVVWGIAWGSSAQTTIAQASSLGSQCYAGMGAPPGCAYGLGSVFLIELVLTFLFVLVIQIVTRSQSQATRDLAPFVIGFTLLIANLVAIPVDGASINPARSFSPALLSVMWPGSRWAIEESWLFWVAPILGGVLAAIVERLFRPTPEKAG
ncbi:MAG: aquaporin [Thermoplasmata archaeon]